MKTRILLAMALVLTVACSPAPEPGAADATSASAQTAAEGQQTAASNDTGDAQDASDRAAAEVSDNAAAEQLRGSVEDKLAAAGYQEGVHYVRLSPTQPTSSGPDQVEVAEFFMYSCPHCYNFEPYVQRWLTTKPAYVSFVRIPTVWNPTVRLHAQAFYAAAALGKGEEMHVPFFREMHENNNYLQSKDAIAAFFQRFDVDRDAFESTFESFAVHASLQRADELARRYGVDSTPTIVVNGKYRTNATMTGGYDQLLELVDALAASERAP